MRIPTNNPLAAAAAAALFLFPSPTDAAPSFRQLYQFPTTPTSTFIENIALRPSTGQLLLSTFTDATMYILDPFSSPSPSPSPLVSFSAAVDGAAANVTGLTGSAAEIAPDVFLVTGSYVRLETKDFAPGTMAVFSLDLSSSSSSFGEEGQEEPEVRLLAHVPETTSMNGMAGLPWEPGVVLSAGSGYGCVYRVDTTKGLDKTSVDVAFTNEEFLGPNDDFTIGINGLKLVEDEHEEGGRKGWMYFTNSAKGFIGRVAVGEDGGQRGGFEIVARLPATVGGTPAKGFAFDDFTVVDNVLYTSQHPNAVDRFPLDGGNITTYLGGGNSTFLGSPTSVTSSLDGAYLYVGTGAGQVFEISTM